MMATNPLSLDALTPATTSSSAGAVRGFGKDFAGLLTDSSRQASETSAPGVVKNDEMREAADQLVATAFILPMLAQARHDPFKREMFHGGRAEEVFGQQLDVIFADNITKSANFGISDALVARFQKPSFDSNQPQVNLRG